MSRRIDHRLPALQEDDQPVVPPRRRPRKPDDLVRAEAHRRSVAEIRRAYYAKLEAGEPIIAPPPAVDGALAIPPDLLAGTKEDPDEVARRVLESLDKPADTDALLDEDEQAAPAETSSPAGGHDVSAAIALGHLESLSDDELRAYLAEQGVKIDGRWKRSSLLEITRKHIDSLTTE